MAVPTTGDRAPNRAKTITTPAEDVVARFRGGEREAAIAVAFGISRERVRQILVARLGAKEKRRVMLANRDGRLVLARSREQQARAERIAVHGRSCRVCGAWYERGRSASATCSPECSDLWKIARYHLSHEVHEKQRERIAQWMVSNPDHPAVRDYNLRWAKKVVNGEYVSRRHNGPQKHTAASQAVRLAAARREQQVQQREGTGAC